MSEKKATVKLDGGRIAILCSKCRKIVKSGKDLTPEELDKIFDVKSHLPAQYCDDCKPNTDNS